MTSEILDSVLLETDFPDLELWASGKVRDIYRVDNERLLFVATDRISAFDYVLPTGIPQKGRVLTGLSLFWFSFLSDIVDNHLLTARTADYPPQLRSRHELAGRSMLVSRADMVPIECVVRGYISGSAWKEYLERGTVCGLSLPQGLKESEKLPEPIFTPATKAPSGHDENISYEDMVRRVGPELGRELKALSLRLYQNAADYALKRGIIIADTKFEFGRTAKGLVLADEALTPDSSRFWPLDGYAPGGPQESFDKQYVRDFLERSGWDKRPPAPPLPPEVVKKTSEKYLEAHRRITERELKSPSAA